MSAKPLRQAMPQVATWIDDLREAFGAEEINGAIRRGLAGEPDFHAVENGHEIGTPVPVYRVSVVPEPLRLKKSAKNP